MNAFKRKNSKRALNPFKRHRRSLSDKRFQIVVFFVLALALASLLGGGFLAAKALLAPNLNTSEYNRAPRMVLCDLYKGLVTGLPPVTVTNSPFQGGAYREQPHEQEEEMESDEDEEMDSDEDEECVNRDWQTETYMECNGMHEVSMFPEPDYFEFINCGTARCAFRLRDIDGNYIVLKTQQ
jgi:hypothetical protein